MNYLNDLPHGWTTVYDKLGNIKKRVMYRDGYELTDKELKVMQYVIEGMHNREIAEILGNSVRTVEIHRANVFDKMEVKSAVELARLLERYGYEH